MGSVNNKVGASWQRGRQEHKELEVPRKSVSGMRLIVRRACLILWDGCPDDVLPTYRILLLGTKRSSFTSRCSRIQ